MKRHKSTAQVPNAVIVVGYNTYNAYGIMRSLGEAGLRPYLILDHLHRAYVGKTRYAREVDEFVTLEAIPSLLMEKYSRLSPTPVVICCDDPVQATVDDHYDELSRHFLLATAGGKQGEIRRLMDKDVQMQYARQAGLDVPRSWHLKRGATIPEDMAYPCFCKPLCSAKGSKLYMKVCHTPQELIQQISHQDNLVQEYIDRDFEAMVWGSWTGGEDYCLIGMGRKIRQWPDDHSLSSYCVLEDPGLHPRLDMDKIKAFLRAMNYRGMFNLEFVVKDGKYYLIEINLRNGGKQHLTTAAEANLPYIFVKTLSGGAIDMPEVKRPTYLMDELTDCRQVVKGRIKARAWLRDFIHTDTFFIANWRDLWPFIYRFFSQSTDYAKRHFLQRKSKPCLTSGH